MTRASELIAVVATVAGLAALPPVLWWTDRAAAAVGIEEGGRVVEITGIGSQGVWTTEPVAGHNYWRRRFLPARIAAAQGERLILRVRSGDVTHGFAVPELGVGPVEVEPGKVKNVQVPTDRAGEFAFACYAVCGNDHQDMVGLLVVAPPGGEASERADWPARLPEGGETEAVVRGRETVNRLNCLACHRLEERGGTAGPDLDRSAVRLRPSFVQSFLGESERIKVRVHPGVMPDMNLTPEDVDSIVRYIAERGGKEYPEAPVEPPVPTPQSIRSGREHVQRYGCFGCHRIGSEQFSGTAPDFLPEREMEEARREAPDLVNARACLDPAWAVEFILSPKRFLPRTRMPRLVVSRSEAEAIRDYLWSLGRE